MQVKSAPKTDIGNEFFVFGYGKLKFGWKKAKLAPNMHLVVTVQNITDKVIKLDSNQIIGLAHKEDIFTYPTSLYKRRVTQTFTKETLPMESSTQKRELNLKENSFMLKDSFYSSVDVSSKFVLPDSLPFGDIIKKFQTKETVLNASLSVESGKVQVSKRDPRLQRLKEKSKDQFHVETFSKKYLQKDHDNKIPKKEPLPKIRKKIKEKLEIDKESEIPIINIDMSRDRICQETLKMVGKEICSIAESNVKHIDKRTIKPKVEKIEREEIFHKNKSTDLPQNVLKNKKENKKNKHPDEHKSKKSKVSEAPVTCFDFLSEPKPKEKSYNYLSKREELMKNSRKSKKSHIEKKKKSIDILKKNKKGPKKHSIKEIDNITLYECQICSMKFNKRKIYKKHIKKDHVSKSKDEVVFVKLEESHCDNLKTKDDIQEERINICSLCGDSFKTSTELTEHISSPHTSPCFNCDLMFVTFESLNNHNCMAKSENISLDIPESETQSLNKPVKKKVKVEALMEMATIEDAAHLININQKLIEESNNVPAKTLECLPIPKEVTIRSPSQEDLLCKSCDIIFGNDKEFFHHSTHIHFENWLFVDETLNQKRNILYPNGLTLEKGSPKGPFTCKLCSETMKTWNQLLSHLWAPHFFKCEYCHKSFNRNTKLEDHVNKEHDFVGLIDLTKCGLCGEIFGRSSSLARHIGLPHNFPCLHCDLKFQSKSYLTKHRKYCAKFRIANILEDCISNVF